MLAEQADITHAMEDARSSLARIISLNSGLTDPSEDLREGMARELHDRVVQTMYAMKVELENFRSSQYGRAAVLREVDLLERLTLEVLSNLRQLVRDLRDEPALQEGLISGLRNHLIPRFEHLSKQTVDLRVSRSWPARLNEQADVNIYRIIQEALTNTWRHSRGQSVSIALELTGSRAVAWVGDAGDQQPDWSSHRVHGNGVLGMRERAALLGGRLTMNSVSGGTVVRASFPLANLLP